MFVPACPQKRELSAHVPFRTYPESRYAFQASRVHADDDPPLYCYVSGYLEALPSSAPPAPRKHIGSLLFFH